MAPSWRDYWTENWGLWGLAGLARVPSSSRRAPRTLSLSYWLAITDQKKAEKTSQLMGKLLEMAFCRSGRRPTRPTLRPQDRGTSLPASGTKIASTRQDNRPGAAITNPRSIFSPRAVGVRVADSSLATLYPRLRLGRAARSAISSANMGPAWSHHLRRSRAERTS